MSAQDLYRLQQSDVQIDELRTEITLLEAELNDQTNLHQSQQNVTLYQEKLSRLLTEQTNKEGNSSSIRAKIASTDDELYSGRVKNPRELQAMQSDRQQLESQENILEQDLLQLMEQSDELAENLRSAESALKKVIQHRDEREAYIHERLGQAREQLNQLEDDRHKFTQGVPPEDLQIYQRLKRTNAGKPVVRIEGGRCRGCNISLPTHEFQRARSQKSIVQCGNCGRVLLAG
jgi:predicted  nucleic acid-binding Zn-ribbon protein